jgi:hypothetical protein
MQPGHLASAPVGCLGNCQTQQHRQVDLARDLHRQPFPSPAPGLLLLDGAAAASPDLRRVFGYVTQWDVLFSLLTVREALLFSPRLHLGATLPVPAKDMHARVDALLQDLTLCRAATIKDLSDGERRRVSIGVEAVHDPAVLITSGLDSASAPDRGRALHLGRDARVHDHTVVAMAGLTRGGNRGGSSGLVAGEGEPRHRIGGCGWIRSRDAGLGGAGEYGAAARVWRGGGATRVSITPVGAQ